MKATYNVAAFQQEVSFVSRDQIRMTCRDKRWLL